MPDTFTEIPEDLRIPDDMCEPCKGELEDIAHQPCWGFDDLAELEWTFHFTVRFCRYHHVDAHDKTTCASPACQWE